MELYVCSPYMPLWCLQGHIYLRDLLRKFLELVTHFNVITVTVHLLYEQAVALPIHLFSPLCSGHTESIFERLAVSLRTAKLNITKF